MTKERALSVKFTFEQLDVLRASDEWMTLTRKLLGKEPPDEPSGTKE